MVNENSLISDEELADLNALRTARQTSVGSVQQAPSSSKKGKTHAQQLEAAIGQWEKVERNRLAVIAFVTSAQKACQLNLPEDVVIHRLNSAQGKLVKESYNAFVKNAIDLVHGWAIELDGVQGAENAVKQDARMMEVERITRALKVAVSSGDKKAQEALQLELINLI